MVFLFRIMKPIAEQVIEKCELAPHSAVLTLKNKSSPKHMISAVQHPESNQGGAVQCILF